MSVNFESHIYPTILSTLHFLRLSCALCGLNSYTYRCPDAFHHLFRTQLFKVLVHQCCCESHRHSERPITLMLFWLQGTFIIMDVLLGAVWSCPAVIAILKLVQDMKFWSALISLRPLTVYLKYIWKWSWSHSDIYAVSCFFWLLFIASPPLLHALCCSVFAHSFPLQSQIRYERNNTHSLFFLIVFFFLFFLCKTSCFSGDRMEWLTAESWESFPLRFFKTYSMYNQQNYKIINTSNHLN